MAVHEEHGKRRSCNAGRCRIQNTDPDRTALPHRAWPRSKRPCEFTDGHGPCLLGDCRKPFFLKLSESNGYGVSSDFGDRKLTTALKFVG